MRAAAATPGRRNTTAATAPWRLRAALGRAEPVAREPGEEPLHLRRVGGGEDDERRAAGLVAGAGPIEQRDRRAAPRVHARVRERLGVERVEPELRRERAARPREAARAGEAADRRVEGGELLGRLARVGDHDGGAGGGGDEPLGRRAAAAAVTGEERERRGEQRAADRPAEHLHSLPW